VQHSLTASSSTAQSADFLQFNVPGINGQATSYRLLSVRKSFSARLFRTGDVSPPPQQSVGYFLFMLFLIRSRVARYSLLPGSAANAFSMEATASAFFSAPIATNA